MKARIAGPLLVTYFLTNDRQIIDASALLAWRSNYLDNDVVFQPEFLHHIIFGAVPAARFTGDAIRLLTEWQATILYERDLIISNGPYYIDNGSVYYVWKVYEDRQLAFVQSTWPLEYDNEYIYPCRAMCIRHWRS